MTSNDLHVNSAKSSRTMICRWSWSHSSGLRRFNMTGVDLTARQSNAQRRHNGRWHELLLLGFLAFKMSKTKKRHLPCEETHVESWVPCSSPHFWAPFPKRGRVIHGGHSKHRPISGWIYQGEFTAWRSTGEYHLLRPRDRKTSAHLRDFQKILAVLTVLA
jgi:hypothetical protein